MATKPASLPPTVSASAMAMSLADFTSIIFSALSTLTIGADLEAHLRRRLRHRIGRDLHRRGQRQPAVLQRLEGQIGGHQLGQRSRLPDGGRRSRESSTAPLPDVDQDIGRPIGRTHRPGDQHDDQGKQADRQTQCPWPRLFRAAGGRANNRIVPLRPSRFRQALAKHRTAIFAVVCREKRQMLVRARQIRRTAARGNWRQACTHRRNDRRSHHGARLATPPRPRK